MGLGGYDPALQGLDPDAEHGAPDRDVQHGLVVVRPALGTMLAEGGLVTSEEIQTAMDESTTTGERLGEVLLRHGWISETDLARTLARQWTLPFLADDEVTVDPRASLLLSPAEAREAGVFPLCFDDQHRTLVAIADPTEGRLDHLRSILGGQVTFAVVTVGTLSRLYDGREPEPTGEADSAASGDSFVTGVPATAEPAAETRDPEPAPEANSAVGLDAPSADFDLAAEALARARARMDDLVEELLSAQTKLGESDRLLAETNGARELERERVTQLEASLAQRDSFIASLRSKFSELDSDTGASP